KLVTTDELDMGIKVDEDYAAVAEDNDASRRIFAIGPLLRGTLWETTAVPELRAQAMRVAEILLERTPAIVEQDDLIEYYI
ncbi:MAG: hypothetical protein GY758_25915, partial [Fuerstiella sp.]|nr:hypothetical protein [Fuerstiella sp.]